jgi:hypothetical protein
VSHEFPQHNSLLNLSSIAHLESERSFRISSAVESCVVSAELDGVVQVLFGSCSGSERRWQRIVFAGCMPRVNRHASGRYRCAINSCPSPPRGSYNYYRPLSTPTSTTTAPSRMRERGKERHRESRARHAAMRECHSVL